MESAALFRKSNQNLTSLERVGIWLHEHSVTTKVTEIATLALGMGLFVGAWAYPPQGFNFFASIALSGFVLSASATARSVFDLLEHSDRVYKTGECEGGELYYKGDVPILSLNADDPFKAGKAHGYLCGEAIDLLAKRFCQCLHTLERPCAESLSKILAAVRNTIPPEYLSEMQGLVEGYNQWANEQSRWKSPKLLTLDDVLLSHLMADSFHFQPEGFEQSHSFRTMDWPSFGLFETYNLIISRLHEDGRHSTLEYSVPGFVGIRRGINDQELSLTMNVCDDETNTLRGMPALFYNRACLEHCQNVSEVEAFVQSRSPLGPYHLTVSDSKEDQTIHFYQAPSGGHLIEPTKEDASGVENSDDSSLCQRVFDASKVIGRAALPLVFSGNQQIESDRKAQATLIKTIGPVAVGALTALTAFCFRKCLLDKTGVRDALTSIILSTFSSSLDAQIVLKPVSSICKYTSSRIISHIIEADLVGPLIEEVFFRGVLQNGLKIAQRTGQKIFTPLQGKTAEWIFSPQARILAINALFAAAHLSNARGPSSTIVAIRQIIFCALFSTEARLYETTGKLHVAIASHMTNNLFASLLTCL